MKYSYTQLICSGSIKRPPPTPPRFVSFPPLATGVVMDTVNTEGVDAGLVDPFDTGVVIEAVNTEGPVEPPVGVGVVAGAGEGV